MFLDLARFIPLISSLKPRQDFCQRGGEGRCVVPSLGIRRENATYRANMKTFKEMMLELKHKHKMVNLMKIDCEKYEYEQFRQWLQGWKYLGVVVW